MKNKIEELKISIEKKQLIRDNIIHVNALSSISGRNNSLIVNSLMDTLGVEDISIGIEGIMDMFKRFKDKRIDIKSSKFSDIKEFVNNHKELVSDFTFKGNTYNVIADKINKSDIGTVIDFLTILKKDIDAICVMQSELFKWENLVSKKPLKRIGFNFSDKIAVFGNKSFNDLIKHGEKNIKSLDKKNNYKINDYRVVPLGYYDDYKHLSFYIVKYITDENGVNVAIVTYELFNVSKVINTSFEVKVTANDFNNDFSSFQTSSLRKQAKMYEGYNETKVNPELDIYVSDICLNESNSQIINSLLSSYEFDFIDDWSLDFKYSDNTYLRYIVNVTLNDYYDNLEQFHFGDIEIIYDFVEDLLYGIYYHAVEEINSKINS